MGNSFHHKDQKHIDQKENHFVNEFIEVRISEKIK